VLRVVTARVSGFAAKIFRVHELLQRKSSGQLPRWLLHDKAQVPDHA
jgi:hypothetical protein